MTSFISLWLNVFIKCYSQSVGNYAITVYSSYYLRIYTFVKDRHTLDDILIANEVVDEASEKKKLI